MAVRQHTLLIVDDEVDVLESLRHLFHRQYRVLTAGSGQEAVELLQNNDVHLILSDQRMPGMTGDVFLGHARRMRPDAIRMLFTGYADIQAVINAVNEGYIFRYILKPWDALELEGIVRQAAEQYELIAERNRLITELQAAKANLERANEELTEAGQLKSAFIEVASHEFNTPITLLLGLSELLRLLDPQRDAQERELIERISASARQLAKLVANTLTLMRKDDFRRTLHRRPVDLRGVLGEVAGRVQPFVHARQLRFTVDLAHDLGTFEIDPEKIADVIVNLLTNAIKFTPDGGEIALTASLEAPDEAVIRVVDRGIGVEPKALAQFFQPFFTQFNPSHHSSGDFGFNKRGLGLGLSIVKQFVELHGGTVWAESAVGAGTQVAIRLPRRPTPPVDGEARPPKAESAAPVREAG
jgi:signal transduction histidine kinase